MVLKDVFTPKRVVLFIVYSFVIIFFGGIIFVSLSHWITTSLYKFKIETYDHEIDSLFNPVILHQVRVKSVYKSNESGIIYYANIDNSYIAIIQTVNFQNINLEDINLTKIEKIKISENKSYYSIIDDKFPLVQQALNPRKSSFLKVLIENGYEVNKESGNNQYHYILGNYNSIVFGNSQNCSIISFPGRDNEVLILKFRNKLYFLLQTIEDGGLLNKVNPNLL